MFTATVRKKAQNESQLHTQILYAQKLDFSQLRVYNQVMIDWKRVAKHFALQLRELRVYLEEERHAHWDIAYALAETAGVPLVSETQVSCQDMIHRALEVLKTNVPSWRHETHQSELDTRLLQIKYLLDYTQQESKLIRGGAAGRVLFRSLIKGFR